MKDSNIGRVKSLAICMLFLLQLGVPGFHYAEAADIEAGLAPKSIWLSRSRVVAADSVKILTVVYNSSNTSITGQVVFSVDDTPIGNKDFALKEGEAQIISQEWLAQAGNHSVSARVTNTFNADTKKITVVLNRSVESIAVNVEKPPPPRLWQIVFQDSVVGSHDRRRACAHMPTTRTNRSIKESASAKNAAEAEVSRGTRVQVQGG